MQLRYGNELLLIFIFVITTQLISLSLKMNIFSVWRLTIKSSTILLLLTVLISYVLSVYNYMTILKLAVCRNLWGNNSVYTRNGNRFSGGFAHLPYIIAVWVVCKRHACFIALLLLLLPI